MPATRIFLSYRRDDSAGYTELLFTRLASHYGAEAVFRDVHSVAPMGRFRESIDRALAECALVLVVISKRWAAIAGRDGLQRLSEPDDVVCCEIATALNRRVPILPVLVGGAQMPQATELPEIIRPLAAINAIDFSDARLGYDFDRIVNIIDGVAPDVTRSAPDINPFNIRGGIRDDAAFFNRRRELQMLRDYIRGRQNCQLVGPRRIGKSSILLFVERHCGEWVSDARVAYIDLQDPRCYTLAGWLKEVGEGLGLPSAPRSLADLMEAVEDLLATGARPVLCLDEFGEMTRRPQEFPREVFMTLRAVGQRGLSILTASPRRLSQLTDPADDTSPFFNTFPALQIGPFEAADAEAYLALRRPGAPEFTERERERILEFAHGHPLALQAACFHVLSARRSGEDIGEAIARAQVDSGV